MYQSKISQKMIIDKRTGNVKLEEFDVNVDGYKNRKKLRKAKNAYNLDKDIEKEYKDDDWPEGMWYYMFEEYLEYLKKWKKNKSKKK